MSALTVEQMEFLAARGLSFADAIEFAKLSSKPKSKGAERIARWRAKKKGITTDDTVENVTSNVTGNALPPPIEDHTPPVSSNDETTPRRKPATTKAAKLADKPESVKPETWEGFQAIRKRKGAPLTESALSGILAEATKAGWELEDALAKCNARGWQGFEADWVAKEPPKSGEPPGDGFLDHLTRKSIGVRA